MIETVQIPILLKAIDILFEQGRKILVERWERRKAAAAQSGQKDQEPDPSLPSSEPEPVPPPEPKPEAKQDLLASKIDELLWKNHEAEVKHLVNLLESHTKNYYILKEQSAKWGSALVPPVILLQLEEKENSILETGKQLENVLSKVYGKDIRTAG
jgi:hypothetical protein